MTPARTSATISERAIGADADSVGDTTSATDTARTPSPIRTRTADDSPNQPYAGLSSVHGCVAAVDGRLLTLLVQQPEPTADHRIADLADRQRARHRARPAQPQQAVCARELVDGGPAFHPGDVVPQRQNLLCSAIIPRSGPGRPAAHPAGRGTPAPRPYPPTSRRPAPSAADATDPRRPPDVRSIRRRPRARCRPCRRRSVRDPRRPRPVRSPHRRVRDPPEGGSGRCRSRSRPTASSSSASAVGSSR